MILNPSTPSPLRDFSAILSAPPVPVVWDVEPLIVHGDRAMLIGAWGSYKSFLLTHLALHLAIGKDWLGWPIPHPRKVLYIDEDMNVSTADRRARRIGLGMGVEGDVPLRFAKLGWRITDYSPTKLIECVKAWAFVPEVVIIETMRRVLVGDENHNADVSRMWSNLMPLSAEGWTVILSHHMSKGNPEFPRPLRDRQSGGTAILSDVDCGFAVVRQGQSNAVDVTQTKQREGEEVATFTVLVESTGDARQGPITLRRDTTFKTPGENPWGPSPP